MSPSQRIEDLTVAVEKGLGGAHGKLVVMIVRRKMSIQTLLRVRDHLREAAIALDKLIAYLQKIKEGE